MPFGDLLESSTSMAVGVMYPGNHDHGGVPLIRVGDVQAGGVVSEPQMRVTAEVHHEYRRTELKGDELLITLVGKPGACVIARPEMKGWNVARALAVARLKSPSMRAYLKAVLEGSVMKSIILGMLNTTVQPTLNLKEIKSLPIPIPDYLGTADSIGAVSELFSQRVALLRQANATLESIAQALFKSWFIDFDPVRAKAEGREPEGMDVATAALFPAEYEESALGVIPKGWRVPAIRNVVADVYDGPHATPPEASEGPVFLGIKNLTGTSLDLGEVRHISEGDWAQWTRRVTPQPNDIVFSYEAALGLFALIPPGLTCCLGRRLALVRPMAKDGTPHFWFHQFIGEPFQRLLDKHTVHGATVNRIALKEFPSFPVMDPGHRLRTAFESVAQPLWARIHANRQQALNLAETRDALLPRLISGKLRLPEARAQIEDAVTT